ncbi:indole-3-acetic acid-amido synthetase GH3.17-like [Gossypium hirsutum]|uniref:Indole-3-acetic acid-amido synthetase GH3.17-like n=1 Tax=Gossypium hirsutum TaxID=3635 RepID=A0ABM2Z616_GOSHI|nr:indole-3-acetic acid-amido synthetase GH3.17-like [Gossypium hirsutum]
MCKIQDCILIVTEKKKRDWALRREKGKGTSEREEAVVNASLSNSDINNRRKLILGEAKKAWDVGKKRTEYLSRFFSSDQADKQSFKTNVPIVTYEDIKPYIDRIANGETSSILFADLITQFIRSAGTSGGQQKLIPITIESFEEGKYHRLLADIVVKKCFSDLDEGKSFYLYFSKPDMKTPSGLVASTYSTFYSKTNTFKNSLAKFCISPIETILCLDNKQIMFFQLLTGLLQRYEVVRLGSIFASVLARTIKFLEDYWRELCCNIRTGYLRDWIIDPGCKNAMSLILTGPNPELADLIQQICEDKSWEGVFKKLWPKIKYISSICTGSMSQYIPLLELYGGGIPLVSPSYVSSEACFGINMKPLSNPFDVSYTFLPNTAYFEFLPVNKYGGGKAQETRTIDKPVDLENVKLGQYSEVVVTTLAGLYRYRVGDVLKVTGFYNGDKTTEEDLSKAITNAKLILEPFGIMLTAYSSYSDTSSTPGRYVLFWELKMKGSNDLPKLDARVMDQCCCIVEESVDFTYKLFRKDGAISALELRVVKHGSFDELMDFYTSKGASISQYKPPCWLKSEEAIKILNPGMVGKFFSPKTMS